jgi:hypothetical protein
MPKSRTRQGKPGAGKQIRKAIVAALQNELVTRQRVDRLEAVLADALEQLIAKGLLPPFAPPPSAQAPEQAGIEGLETSADDAVGERSGLDAVEAQIPVAAVP